MVKKIGGELARDLAFELFSQGKRPSDPEVKELGIKNATLYRYFRFWKSNNPNRTETTESSSPLGLEQPLTSQEATLSK